jgi:nucleoside-diphosphate-sugar epimerase
MRVFVTGGTGHSGSYIIPELTARTWSIAMAASSQDMKRLLIYREARFRHRPGGPRLSEPVEPLSCTLLSPGCSRPSR